MEKINQIRGHIISRISSIVIVMLFAMLLSGCGIVGPTTYKGGDFEETRHRIMDQRYVWLTLKNGDDFRVKVLDMTPYELRYRKFKSRLPEQLIPLDTVQEIGTSTRHRAVAGFFSGMVPGLALWLTTDVSEVQSLGEAIAKGYRMNAALLLTAIGAAAGTIIGTQSERKTVYYSASDYERFQRGVPQDNSGTPAKN